MSKHVRLLLITLTLAAFGCDSGPHASIGFQLPPDGNAEHGKAVFVAFGCNTCHEVAKANLPMPTVKPPVPVVLGGETERVMTDGYLVTSIIYPSYQLAAYPKEQITAGGETRMPHFADRMTIRELTDLVAFLQTQYTVTPLTRNPYY